VVVNKMILQDVVAFCQGSFGAGVGQTQATAACAANPKWHGALDPRGKVSRLINLHGVLHHCENWRKHIVRQAFKMSIRAIEKLSTGQVSFLLGKVQREG
jgi:hypothetical protein